MSFTVRRLSQLQLDNAVQQLSPEEVISSRSGDVLIKHTVLKADHFPRQRKVYWQNLREEPLVFINGHPFVVREADQPFSNLEYTGIDKSRVEEMEERLKQDILAEARQFANQILVVHENEDLSLLDQWEPVTPNDVLTPQEVYAELIADGYNVDYLRVPITDEKAPKDSDFELLIQRLWQVPVESAVVFNCQMGRGRTTTGMVIASLLFLRRLEAFPIKRKADTRDVVPGWFKQVTLRRVQSKEVDKLKNGMYGVVRSLLRVLDNGPEAKLVLDSVIDACSAMQNLREGIAAYRSRFLKEIRERQRNTLLSVCLEYLERYYMLIAFSAYLSSPLCDPARPTHMPFQDWMEQRAELRSILMRLLRRNSMAALELHMPLGGQPASDGGAEPTGQTDHPDNPEKDVVGQRSGAVLGPFTILKEDNFPGMRSHKVPQAIEGAPNFRRLSSMPIFGVGMPTVEGIVSVLKAVSGSTSPNASKRTHALWINMREEPVVYINGKPFVLREEVRPLKNMQEYAGIDAARVEAMEERLKKDVLAEALKFGGRILVALESFEPGHNGELNDAWEEIDHPDAVQTPAEVYQSLTKQGFAVKYARIPVTDGTAPIASDFDDLMMNILDFGLENPVIFNCQMGIGRTTTGMVVAGLIHLYSEGAMASARSASVLLEDVDAAHLREYLVAGMSPRSDNEQDEFRDEEDEAEPKVWELEPEQLEEQKALAAGGYVGVRRISRLLEEGENSKKIVDNMLDAASDLINLRIAIMKYRKPRSSYKYLRPELQQRNAAFKRGSAYLERYCWLIAFAFYLEHVGPETSLFSQWVKSRPDLQAALTFIRENPAAALAPLPVARVPALYQPESEGDLTLEEQKRVLGKRRGRTLTKRNILKSYLSPDPAPVLSDVPDLRQADNDLPIYSVGNIPASSLELLLKHLGAIAEGSKHVIISDVREELVVYVNGTPYIRRELEMPAAALHHAGIHATQLEELEVLLKEDVQVEVSNWGGRILLHREIDRPSNSGAAEPRRKQDDVTALVDLNPGAAVAPFWESVNVSDASSLQTPVELMEGLAAAGYHLSYQRIPLSRERTPEADDVDHLHEQLLDPAVSQQDQQGKTMVHLILSRTATGSSARFVAAAFGSYYIRPPGGSNGITPTNSGTFVLPSLSNRPSFSYSVSSDDGGSSGGGAPKPSLDLGSGEYRGIMSLCRLLPGGFEAKLMVDKAIASCSQIGNLLSDIQRCREQMVSASAPVVHGGLQFAARQLGLHYLKRYFLLITYRAFLEHGGSSRSGFAEWMHLQKELHHLLNSLQLES